KDVSFFDGIAIQDFEFALSVGEGHRAMGAFLDDGAGVDFAVAGDDPPGDELRGDFLARRKDRFDQFVARGGPADGGRLGPNGAAAAVDAMADETARAAGMEKDALAGRRVAATGQGRSPSRLGLRPRSRFAV